MTASSIVGSLSEGKLGVAPNQILLLVGVSLLAVIIYQKKSKEGKKVQGPKGLPVIGNLFQVFSGKPYLTFTKWSQEFGDLYSLKLGSHDALVINSAEVAREALVTKGKAFAGRPKFYSMNAIHENEKKFVFSPENDDLLKLYRKTVLSDSRKRIHVLNSLAQAEMEKLEETLFSQGQQEVTLHLGPVLNQVAANIAQGYAYGRTYDLSDPRIDQWIKAVADYRELLHWFRLENFLPYSNILLKDFDKKVVEFRQSTRELFLDGIEDARKRFKNGATSGEDSCLVDTMFEMFESTKQPLDATDEDIIAVLRDVVFGCSDGAFQPMNWACLFLAQRPEVQNKLYNSIASVLKTGDKITIADKDQLPFVEATIREVFRCGEITTLGIPHNTLEETELCSYHVPKDTLTIINVHAIHRDERHWSQPNIFNPHRFLNEAGQLRPLSEISFLPFSTGQRSCPGQNLARNFLFLLFTHFFLHFELTIPADEDIPEEVNAGGAFNPEMKPFRLTISKRNRL